ncbi:MAG: deoxyribose-phosphate aldolase [Deltaproteobacteria bacterium]|nr:deoxyribose-phosphate aldolase [Deltaproteobacteria bacterium]
MQTWDVLIDDVTERVQKRINCDILLGKTTPKTLTLSHMTQLKPQDLAEFIDHTLLKPDVTRFQLEKLCKEAVEYNFKTVCVNSSNIPLVVEYLRGSSVLPIAVVGFPLGAATTSAKIYESQEAIQNGAQEIDMVMNIGALKSQDYEIVFKDIEGVVRACKSVPVKVILETAMLGHEEKIIACVLSKLAKAAFVKTSTGFGPGGATVEDVKLMRKTVGTSMGVKASGGIRTYQDAVKMIEAGANRVGASSSVAIVTGSPKKKWQFDY